MTSEKGLWEAGNIWQLLPYQHASARPFVFPILWQMGFWAQGWFGSICWSFRPLGCHPGMDSLLPLPCHNKLYGISKSFPQTCPIYHCSLYSSYGVRCCLTFFLFSQGQWDNLETEIKSTGTKGRRNNGLPARIAPWCITEPILSLPGPAPRVRRAGPGSDPCPAVLGCKPGSGHWGAFKYCQKEQITSRDC